MSTPAPSIPAELPKAYKPADHEARIWDRWIAAKAFHADPAQVVSGKKKPYAVLIPPPNVTDRLHLGHGLNNTLQDILVRWHRMRGDETLWMPGTDHAGIATQAVVEKRVMKDEKKRRTDFSREEFVKKIQAFKDEYEATITGQLKKMGCSCDWDRQRFTMDPMCATAVREAFFRLFKDGLIYRGKRLVNWDPALQTAVADDECYDEELDTSFWYLRYPLVHASSQDPAIRTGGRTNVDAMPVTWSELARRGYPGAGQHDPDAKAWVTVATTRPETYLGDTAVAINPHDPRAKALRGFFVELPLVGRIIPIVEDSYVVLPKQYARTEEEAADPKAEFATGFLKVTPAHDPNDYEIGRRHTLDIINMMAPDGSVSDKHGWTDIGDAHMFVGKKRDEARKLVVQEFKTRGLLEEVKPYRHSVKHSDRSKAIIEPYLSDQWYVKVTDPRLAQAANAALVPDQRTGTSSTNASGMGVPPVSTPSTSSAPSPLPRSNSLKIHTRHLPHWELGGQTYFITFRSQAGEFSPAERDIILSACKHWDGDRLELHAAVVMPDHVHLIFSPFERAPGQWHELADILHSIKSFTSHEIAKSRGTPGTVWQQEYFDRIIRPDEFGDTLSYVLTNPMTAGIVTAWRDYKWTFAPPETLDGSTRFATRWRSSTGSDGRDAHPTSLGREDSKTYTTDASLRFYPARYAKTFEQWHDGIRDWCISRQLWWGHRIPVWSRTQKWDATEWLLRGFVAGDTIGQPATLELAVRWVAENPVQLFELRDGTTFAIRRSITNDMLTIHVCPSASTLESEAWKGEQSELTSIGFTQDPDVLDTWFSSALWPMSTMGWPNPGAFPETAGLLEAFNRNDRPESQSTLCTAREIITLWVSRMVMFNRYFRGEDLGNGQGKGPVPFKDVFIHAVVQDGEGRKMSKSLGNGVDPLDIISSHGADAMRFTLCKMSTQTQDVRMPIQKDSVSGKNTSPKFDEGRNFCNKLWNAARFAIAQVSSSPLDGSMPHGSMPASLIDRWMLSRLSTSISEINAALTGYHYAEYAQCIYDLLWRDFCDWYLEGVKGTIAGSPTQQAVLARTLDAILRLLHPIAPFVTEAIFENFSHVKAGDIKGLTLAPPTRAGTLCTAGWPVADASLADPAAEQVFERMRTLVTSIRETRAQLNVQPKRKITLHAPAAVQSFIKEMGGLVDSLAGIEKTENLPASKPDGAAEVRFEGATLLLTNLADAVDAGSEKARLEKLTADLKKSIGTLEGRLNNPGYADRAPAAMVQQTRDQLQKAKDELAAAEASLAKLG